MFSLKRLRNSRGFTMIELLVVIAVIGVLAVAVLSAINPIEQINKGKDTRSRSDAAELLGSVERYYSTQEFFPWNVASAALPQGTQIAANAPGDTDPDSQFTAEDTAAAWNFLGTLVESNEVKPAFGQRVWSSYNAQADGDETFAVLKELDSDNVRVCFLPTSRQFKLEAAKRCCTVNTGICASAGSLANMQPEDDVAGFPICANHDGTNWDQATTRNLICLP